MPKIVSIVGARPQFIKLAPICRELETEGAGELEHVVVHTGQHYDKAMSERFFEELGIHEPKHNLGVGSGTHAVQTGRMLVGIEEALVKESPQAALVYGDTNSTLAGALAAAKLHVPVLHVEAGLRSYNRAMPEEINRVATDHVSDVLLCPSRKAVEILAGEGIVQGVHFVGDVMYDAVLYASSVAQGKSQALGELGLKPKGYFLATVHRPRNTDDLACLKSILSALAALPCEVVFPVHPRTRKVIDANASALGPPADNVRLTEPLGYLDVIMLLRHSRMLLTDSGGMQKEAFFLGVPCITLRDETEWPETVDAGWNCLVGSDAGRTLAAVEAFEAADWSERGERRPQPYGDGHAARKILDVVRALLGC